MIKPILNERGTYDVKLPGQPNRTFTTEADAKKFLNNNSKAATVTPAGIKPQTASLTPIQPGKAPFAKKFWAGSDIDIKSLKPENLSYNPEKAVSLGKQSQLTPIQPGKAPFAKKFWASGDIDIKSLKPENLTYKPELMKNEGKTILGKPECEHAPKSLREIFSVKNIKNVFKGKRGKVALAAGTTILLASGAAAAIAANYPQGGNYSITYLKSPNGYRELLAAHG